MTQSVKRTNFAGRFVDGAKQPTDGWKGISPLFTYDMAGNPQLLGTTFFISKQGAMLTAKHCLFNNAGKQFDRFFILQFLDMKHYMLRSIYKCYFNESDIAGSDRGF